MASRTYNKVEALYVKPVDVSGSFAPDGANAPTDINGTEVASVVRDNTGEFTVTLSDTFRKVVAETCSLRLAATADLQVQFGAFSNVGTSTPVSFKIYTRNAGGVQDIAADPNNRVNFRILFNDSDAY